MNGTPTHFVFSKIFDFQLKKKKMKFIYTFLTKQLSIKKKMKFIYTFLTKLPKSYGFVYDFHEICLLKR